MAQAGPQGRLVVLAAVVVLCVIWSSTWLGIKIGLHGAPPLLGAGCRFLLAGACLAVWRLARRESLRVRRRDLGFMAVLSATMFAIPYTAVYLGETQVTSGLAAVLFGSMPFFSTLVSARLLPDERVTARRLVGSLAGIGGLAIVFHGALSIRSGALVVAGILGLVLSPASSAVGQALQKAHGHRLPITLSLSWSMLSTGVVLVAVAAATGPFHVTPDARTLGSIAYLALLGSVAGFALYFRVLRSIGAVTVSLVTLVIPILALVEGALIYDEPLNAWVGAGTAVVAAAMAVVLLPVPARLTSGGGLRRATRSAPPAPGVARPRPPG